MKLENKQEMPGTHFFGLTLELLLQITLRVYDIACREGTTSNVVS